MFRDDGLPHPSGVGDYYLAALLDEIRGLRAEMKAKTEPKPAEPGTVNVKEPEVSKAGPVKETPKVQPKTRTMGGR